MGEIKLIFWIGLGVVSLVAAVRRWVLRRGARDWPVVVGTVEGHFTLAKGHGDATVDVEEVTYSYKVEGEWYNGSVTKRVSAWKDTSDLFDRYPRNKPVLVHYNPRKPEHSALDEEVNRRG